MFRRFPIKSTLRLINNVKIANQRSPFPQEVRKLIIKSAQRVYKMCILLKLKLVSIIFLQTDIRRTVKRTSWNTESN